MVTQNKYAAELIFQFRVEIDRQSNKRRTVERRIIHLDAQTARQALKAATRYGKREQYDYRNTDGDPVFFEFIGVTDLMELGSECDERTVWYDIRQMLTPMERKDSIIPAERELSAIKHARKSTPTNSR